MKINQSDLLYFARNYGALIVGLPDSIDGRKLLWALSGVESSFGQNVSPRHEAEYCPISQWHQHLAPDAVLTYVKRPGLYASDPGQPDLYKQFGCLSCCSFTPWQLMSAHSNGFTPLELLNDLEKGTQAVLAFMNKRLAIAKPQNLSEFAHVWNGAATDAQYIADLTKYYNAAS